MKRGAKARCLYARRGYRPKLCRYLFSHRPFVSQSERRMVLPRYFNGSKHSKASVDARDRTPFDIDDTRQQPTNPPSRLKNKA